MTQSHSAVSQGHRQRQLQSEVEHILTSVSRLEALLALEEPQAESGDEERLHQRQLQQQQQRQPAAAILHSGASGATDGSPASSPSSAPQLPSPQSLLSVSLQQDWTSACVMESMQRPGWKRVWALPYAQPPVPLSDEARSASAQQMSVQAAPAEQMFVQLCRLARQIFAVD